jgi:hypothetical protein
LLLDLYSRNTIVSPNHASRRRTVLACARLKALERLRNLDLGLLDAAEHGGFDRNGCADVVIDWILRRTLSSGSRATSLAGL